MPQLLARTEQSAFMVGRTPRSAADAPVGLLAPSETLISLFRQRDVGVPAQRAPRPGGPPHRFAQAATAKLFMHRRQAVTEAAWNAGRTPPNPRSSPPDWPGRSPPTAPLACGAA